MTGANRRIYRIEEDEDKERFRINGSIYEYSDLWYFQLLQDDVVCTEKAECEKAKKCWTLKIEARLRDSFKDTEFIIFLNEKHMNSEGNPDFGIRTESEEYRKAAAEAWECMDALQVIADINEYREPPRPSPDPAPAPDRNPETAPPARDTDPMPRPDPESEAAGSQESAASSLSAADQILQIRMNREILGSYRKLLDAGMITEEEFRAREKEILGRQAGIAGSRGRIPAPVPLPLMQRRRAKRI